MRTRSVLLMMVALVVGLLAPGARAQEGEKPKDESWQKIFGAIPIQDGGRVMPLDTYARRLAVDLTGRTKWGSGNGPAAFNQREAIELLADLMAKRGAMMKEELILVDHRGLKTEIGLNPERRFFAPVEIMTAGGLQPVLGELQRRRQIEEKVKPTPIERNAESAWTAAVTVGNFGRDMHFAIVPQVGSPEFLAVDAGHGPAGTEDIQAALAAFLDAYLTDNDPAGAARRLQDAINAYAPLPAAAAQDIRLEHFYNLHKPWRMAAIASILALLLILARWILRLKVFGYLAAAAIAWAVVEQSMGLTLRVLILNRPPVSNTYEAILWIGIVALGCGLVGQAINRKGWYLVAGLSASLVALLFAQLVPLSSQTNSIPAVLRSNYWLLIHVMTIVASYGAFLLAAVLGHAYLLRDVILRRKPDPKARLIVQTYRLMQVGLVLLTAGTILGGVWAAESWGRFWGWDPKETWSLICIVLYFVMLHARYCGWIKDFGLSVAAVLGFLSIVWCFYGVNYVMATGLHSYGFGSGGEKWVFLWGLAEIVFIAACFVWAHIGSPGKIVHTMSSTATPPAAPTT